MSTIETMGMFGWIMFTAIGFVLIIFMFAVFKILLQILISISCTNTERDGLVLDQRQQQTRTVVISKSFDDKPPCYDEALSQ
ncbi:hypothetical protein NH340_JMT06795 [Sarcoptes scabiei]|nr:hypothetical protein NH340_JMT06795 [Sarcoptes scabiei]